MSLSKTPKGTKHRKMVRKSTIGRAVPRDHMPARSWETLTASLPKVAGRHRDPEHPSRKHDVVRPEPEFLVVNKGVNRAMRRHLPFALVQALLAPVETEETAA